MLLLVAAVGGVVGGYCTEPSPGSKVTPRDSITDRTEAFPPELHCSPHEGETPQSKPQNS